METLTVTDAERASAQVASVPLKARTTEAARQ